VYWMYSTPRALPQTLYFSFDGLAPTPRDNLGLTHGSSGGTARKLFKAPSRPPKGRRSAPIYKLPAELVHFLSAQSSLHLLLNAPRKVPRILPLPLEVIDQRSGSPTDNRKQVTAKCSELVAPPSIKLLKLGTSIIVGASNASSNPLYLREETPLSSLGSQSSGGISFNLSSMLMMDLTMKTIRTPLHP
jgi:hypothetical protein